MSGLVFWGSEAVRGGRQWTVRLLFAVGLGWAEGSEDEREAGPRRET